eukprot:jgi/Ulvmu1/8498/UM044_0032.1
MASLQGIRSPPRQYKCLSDNRKACLAENRPKLRLERAVPSLRTAAASPGATAQDSERDARWENVKEGQWQWKGHNIRYQRSGESGVPVLLVHGFGANADHWRKNTPEIGQWGRAYAIDLLGYGYSDKPEPSAEEPNTIYNFETWADQLEAFIDEVIQEPAVVVCNSVGGLSALVLAKQAPSKVQAVQLMNISLRMLHVSKQAAFARPLVSAFQRLLRKTPAGAYFFSSLAKPQAIKNVLSQAYGDASAVNDELVDCILKPGLQPGAVKVFLDFISYSSGPLPEELIPSCPVPVGILWGSVDPWEKVEWGRALAEYDTVVDYVELEGVGHCPQDESPERVNPEIKRFVSLFA